MLAPFIARRILPVLLLLLASRTSLALIKGPTSAFDTHSVEALSIDSNFILHATVIYVAKGDYRWTMILSVRAILKAPAQLDPAIRMFEIETGDCAQKLQAGSELLLFGGMRDPDRPRRMDIWIHDFILLDTAQIVTASGASPRDLALLPVTDPARVLSIVKSEIARSPTTAKIRYFYSMPYGICAVPDDDRLLPAAHEWVRSGDPVARMLAAQVFALFPDAQDTAALKTLLNDPTLLDVTEEISPWSSRVYPVRHFAAKALQARNEAFDAPVESMPWDGLYQPITWMSVAAIIMPAALATWFLRRRAARDRRRWSIVHTAMNGFSILCVWLSILTAALWWRSYYTLDEVVVASHGLLLNVDSIQGHLVVETTSHWPTTTNTRPVHVAITPSPSDPSLLSRSSNVRSDIGIEGAGWNLYDIYTDSYDIREDASQLSVEHSKIGPVFELFSWPRAGGYDGIRILCGYPYLLLMFMVFPVGRQTLQFVLGSLKRRRAAKRVVAGLCSACGYDLRAHTGLACCPECGTVNNTNTVACP